MHVNFVAHVLVLRLGHEGRAWCIGHPDCLARTGLLSHVAPLDYATRLRMQQLFHAVVDCSSAGFVPEWCLHEFSRKILSDRLCNGPMVVSEPYEHVRHPLLAVDRHRSVRSTQATSCT